MKSKARILIVEDQLEEAELLKEIVTREGYDAVHTQEARVALELLQTGDFQTVLLDLMMPGLDGWDFLEELRTLPQQRPKLPVIVITALKIKHLHSDMSVLINKPIDPDSLIQELHRLLPIQA